MVFVRNGFCLHMAYNTINTEHLNNQKQIENYYSNNLLNKNYVVVSNSPMPLRNFEIGLSFQFTKKNEKKSL